jgi:hypothetical protein
MNTIKERKIIQENEFLRYLIPENNTSFICDLQDYQLLKKHNWLIDSYGYPVTKIRKRCTRFSRMIMHPPEGIYIDHINGDPSDNRRKNLRLATELDNQRNMCLPKHNSSGFKGVSFRRDRGKFRAYISLHNKIKHLGTFENAEDAARAYDEAARFYFGSFACLNFPNPGEQSCFRNR